MPVVDAVRPQGIIQAYTETSKIMGEQLDSLTVKNRKKTGIALAAIYPEFLESIKINKIHTIKKGE